MFPRDYQPVSKEEQDGENGTDSDTTITSRPRRRAVSYFLKRNLGAITIIGLLLIVALLVICDVVFITVKFPSKFVLVNQASNVDDIRGQRQCLPPAPRTLLACGNSTAEAKAHGCSYDPLSACWLPKECPRDYNHEFSHFNNGKPFVYFYDEAATRQMKDYDEVGMNENGHYWTSVREHLVHCLYLLRRGHDVHMRGDRLDSMLGSIEHVDHCTDFLANWLRRDDPALNHIGTQGKTSCFNTCS